MEAIAVENLSFCYPNRAKAALSDVSFAVDPGEWITICGPSGCGKTTLLRMLKPALTPHGERTGRVLVGARPVEELGERAMAKTIGFVQQSPDDQLVTDMVWHELAFGLESFGRPSGEIRARVAEIAAFFGIEPWFHKEVCRLSGGQKQILNLASALIMEPSILLLDEPTSQLDPIASDEFLKALTRVNREMGVTVLMTEHRLEEAVTLSDRVLVLDAGRLLIEGAPPAVCGQLREKNHPMLSAMPTPARVWAAFGGAGTCPITVREGRSWLKGKLEADGLPRPLPASPPPGEKEEVLAVSDLWFRYDRTAPDVLKGLTLALRRGETFALLGGNGAGKTTALAAICGLARPYRGDVTPLGEGGKIALLPQNPEALFVGKTVEEDLFDALRGTEEEQAERRVAEVADLCGITGGMDVHPFDLSGGERQKAALAKVLLKKPDILLLDEPTKGLDTGEKERLAGILARLKGRGVAVCLVSHDVEFCARHADRCALLFDGAIVCEGEPRQFFAGLGFYTTAAGRMARGMVPRAILAEEIVYACGGSGPGGPEASPEKRGGLDGGQSPAGDGNDDLSGKKKTAGDGAPAKGDKVRRKRRFFWGAWCLVGLFAAGAGLYGRWGGLLGTLVQLGMAALLMATVWFFFGTEQRDFPKPPPASKGKKRGGGGWITAAVTLAAVPLTIWAGIAWFGDRRYVFISLLLILETLIPFAVRFEARKPKARELVTVAALCALAAAGRAAFFMVPQFKPALALVILSGVSLGGETGFVVGAASALLSNLFLGQGPWTPWQMFAYGVIGLLAGMLFFQGRLPWSRGGFCLFGGLAAVILYGGIMNPASVLMVQSNPTAAMFWAAYALGLPLDLVHGAATAFFLWFLAGPLLEKLDRLRVKYGLLT